MIISVDTEKINKIQHLTIIKPRINQIQRHYYLNIIKVTYDQPIAIILNSKNLKVFPLK
jgi:hypothetical protein